MASLTLSLQIVLISTGILSLALLLRVSVPLVIDFSVYQAPLLWISLSSWFKPPYLYVILNCIIITIAASSRFYHNKDHHNQPHQQRQHHEQIPAPKISLHQPDLQFHYDMKISAAAAEEIASDYGGLGSTVVEPEIVYEQREEEKIIEDVFEDKSTVVVNGDKEDADDFVISKSTWIPPKRIAASENPPVLLLRAEKPLVSARFGHRNVAKARPEGIIGFLSILLCINDINS